MSKAKETKKGKEYDSDEEEQEEEMEGEGDGEGEEMNQEPRKISYCGQIPTHNITPAIIDRLLHPGDDFTAVGAQMLRGGKRSYTPCVLDRTGWENFYLSLPFDYDIKNDPVFSCLKSTYHRIGDLGFKWPEPTTSEALRTGHCGPDPASVTRPSFLHRTHDRRPEPAYRMHLADRTALHYMRADPLEGVLPFGRQGDMLKSRSVSHRDFKWRAQCCAKKPTHPTYERVAHRIAQNDLHDQRVVPGVTKFQTDQVGDTGNSRLMKLKRAYLWPIDTITGEPLGGHLMYHNKDPCEKSRQEIWPNGENNVKDSNPYWIPEQRCSLLANGLRSVPRMPGRHYYNKSYLDMRYPIRNYECWEEVPGCCGRPDDIPKECNFVEAHVKLPEMKTSVTCPPKGPCPTIPSPPY